MKQQNNILNDYMMNEEYSQEQIKTDRNMSTITNVKYSQFVKYLINYKYSFKLPIKARVVPVTLAYNNLSSKLILKSTSIHFGYLIFRYMFHAFSFIYKEGF